MVSLPVINYDKVDNFMLFHYEKPESIVRGCIVDDTCPDRPRAVSHVIQLPIITSVLSEGISNLGLSLPSLTFTRGYESTTIRVWYYNSKVETSTHKRIRPEASRWGKSVPFSEMYRELKGPTDDLFTEEDVEKGYSDICYIFLMVHPDVLIASQDPNVGSGYLVFIGGIDMNKPRSMVRPFTIPNHPEVKLSEDISMDSAHDFLTNGFGPQVPHYVCNNTRVSFPDDTRLGPGEFVMTTEWEGVPWESDIRNIYQFVSVGYNYRSLMRNNDPNLIHRVFVLSRQVVNYRDINDYTLQFPWISSIMPVDQTGHYKGSKNESIVPIEKSNQTQRLYNIWNVFLFCVPPTTKAIVSSYFHYFHLSRYNLAGWLTHMARSGQAARHPYTRVGQIVAFARSRGGNLLNQIQLILKAEQGESLYRLVNKHEEHMKMKQ